MTGLDHKQAGLETREEFAVTKEKSGRLVLSLIENCALGGCVLINTCNRTELYVSVPDGVNFEPTKKLCGVLNKDYTKFGSLFTERTEGNVIEYLCRVASGLESQILGDDQVITQVREALEFSRGQGCTDRYLETMFKLAIKAAKDIKTNVIIKTLGTGSIPEKAVEKLKEIYSLTGKKAVVIGNGKMGRLVSELLISEGVRVVVTLREYHKGVIVVPNHAETVGYTERYRAIEEADLVVSATTSPHYTLCLNELKGLSKLPEIIVDLAVPRDAEPSISTIPGISLLTIDDISEEGRFIPEDNKRQTDRIIGDCVERYYRWLAYKGSVSPGRSGASEVAAAEAGGIT